MSDLISREAAIDAARKCSVKEVTPNYMLIDKTEIMTELMMLSSVEPEIIYCKDCIHQEKYFHEDARRKDGGYYIYGCELAEEYSHVCLDDDFCSKAERRTDE